MRDDSRIDGVFLRTNLFLTLRIDGFITNWESNRGLRAAYSLLGDLGQLRP